ncbi:MAG: AraC family transcriptional regulator [Flavobacteriaceae bacterium]|nr:AraC family transcriptional regulator [Flavobacteriaceae bacterium]
MDNLLSKHKKERNLTTLIENRTTYNASYSELNIYETHAFSEKVALKFDVPIIASMLTGKKVMHLKGMPSFEFLPGESVVVPSNEKMIIDFPIATLDNPTQCLALAIDPSKINEIACNFNELVSIENENNNWSIDSSSSHLTNQSEVNHLIERLVHTFTQNTKSKDIILDLMIQELIVRLLQTKAKKSILNDTFSDTRIGTVIKFINNHLTDKDITVDLLAKKAYMSTSHFHKQFKNTLGVSPIDYINSERIKFSKKIISNNNKLPIGAIAFKSGFNSISYFNRQFKKHELIIPSQYRKIVNQ